MFSGMLLYIAWRTIAGNIKLPLEIMGYSKSEQLRRTDEVLRLVELEDFSKNFLGNCPAECNREPSIARALAFDAELLLMDEPFGALDEIVRDHLNEQLLELLESARIKQFALLPIQFPRRFSYRQKS